MASESDQSKEFEPSQRKLEESRRRGEIAHSIDLNTVLSQLGFLAVILGLGGQMVQSLGSLLETFLTLAAANLDTRLTGSAGQPSLILKVVGTILPLFLVPATLVLCPLIASKGIVFSTDKIIPKLERINPLKTAKQKYGFASLVEFLKSFLKLGASIALVAIFSATSLDLIAATSQMDPRRGLIVTFDRLTTFLTLAVAMAVMIGGADLIWQVLRHRSRLRMSRQEMKEETRESEGDGDLKQRRRQKGYDIATNRMLQDVATAQVVIVNPTHYAIALQWDATSGHAPVCVAKGVEEIAFRIREAAKSAGVPIHHDPPTARTLHASVEVGQEIQPDQYRAVAAAIRFAERMRKKMKGRP